MKLFLKTSILLFVTCLSLFACSKDDESKLSPAQFSIDQSTVDFGEVIIPESKEIKLTITNTGEQDLELKGFAFSGSNASAFSVDAGDTEEIVQGGKTYELVITFEPVETGDKTAVLTITSNIGEHKVSVSGKAFNAP